MLENKFLLLAALLACTGVGLPSMFPPYEAIEHHFSDPTPLGMALVRRGGGLVVKRVHGQGQASKAGVREGMQLIAIGREPTDRLSLKQATERLKSAAAAAHAPHAQNAHRIVRSGRAC